MGLVAKRLVPVALLFVAVVGVAVAWDARTSGGPSTSVGSTDASWAALDPQARCESAIALVTHPARWPMTCQWRVEGEGLTGQAFPPPKGPPPYDSPHIEIYVARSQSREEVAHAIAHEFGHMHHTRQPTFVADWLAARNLPATTLSEIWTEDYAEVFAALFSPPTDIWRAPTPRPSPGALVELKARFFQE